MVELALLGIAGLFIVGWIYLMWMFPTLRYGLPIAYVAMVFSGWLHELGHGIGNGLTGGTWGFTSTAGDIIGGYGLEGIYAGFYPVFYINVQNVGDFGWMLLAGPWTSIFLGFIIVRLWNYQRLRNTGYGWFWPIGKWIMAGFLVRQIMASIYLLPIDVFPNDVGTLSSGDGMALYYYWQRVGLDWSGGGLILNLEYIIGLIAIVFSAYTVWYAIMTSKAVIE